MKLSRTDIATAKALRTEDVSFWSYRQLAERFGVSAQAMFYALSDASQRRAAIIRRASLGPPTVTRLRVSVEQDAAIRLTEIPEDTRDLTGRFFGDPLPGRSALDQKKAKDAR